MKKFLPQVKINLYTSTFIPKVEAYKLILIYERSLIEINPNRSKNKKHTTIHNK